MQGLSQWVNRAYCLPTQEVVEHFDPYGHPQERTKTEEIRVQILPEFHSGRPRAREPCLTSVARKTTPMSPRPSSRRVHTRGQQRVEVSTSPRGPIYPRLHVVSERMVLTP